MFDISLLSLQKHLYDSMVTEINNELILHVKKFNELTVDELYNILHVRSEVFVVEQNCIYQDLDNDDQNSIHLWLTNADDNKILAVARVCPAGTHMKEVSIGRVTSTKRGCHYGLTIVESAVKAAINEFNTSVIEIEAQEYTKKFYEKVGFRQTSEAFLLDEIPHIKMTYKV